MEEAHDAINKAKERDAQHQKDKDALEKALADERHQRESHEAEHEKEISQVAEDLKHVKVGAWMGHARRQVTNG